MGGFRRRCGGHVRAETGQDSRRFWTRVSDSQDPSKIGRFRWCAAHFIRIARFDRGSPAFNGKPAFAETFSNVRFVP
jgi:hypothetical protein